MPNMCLVVCNLRVYYPLCKLDSLNFNVADVFPEIVQSSFVLMKYCELELWSNSVDIMRESFLIYT